MRGRGKSFKGERFIHAYAHTIPGVQKKTERPIFSTLRAKSIIFFLHLPQKRMIPRSLNLVDFDFMPISWNTVIFKFCLIFATDEHRIVSGKAFYNGVLGKPIPCQQKIQCKRKQAYERPFPTQSMLISRKNQVKFKNDCISRRGHRFKITQPNLMILVSLSSPENALSNDLKNMKFLARKVLKIRRSAFLGTPGM